MNSDNEIEGRKLIHAWKSAANEILIKFDSASRSSSLNCAGRISTLGDSLIVLSIGNDTVVEIDLTDSRFSKVGTQEIFRQLNLSNPERYREMVEIHLGDMGRLALFGPGEL
jgi:hypothetical protein